MAWEDLDAKVADELRIASYVFRERVRDILDPSIYDEAVIGLDVFKKGAHIAGLSLTLKKAPGEKTLQMTKFSKNPHETSKKPRVKSGKAV